MSIFGITRYLAVAAAYMALANAATPDAAPSPPWRGVWQGAIGTYSIHMCLQASDYGALGAYYYDRQLKIITLKPADEKAAAAAVDSWIESSRDNKESQQKTLKLLAPNGDTLAGTWQSGAKTLPITLTRLPFTPTDDNPEPCGSDAFNRPREAGGNVSITNATFNGIPYRLISVEAGKHFNYTVSGFELVGDDPATHRVNQALTDGLPHSKAEMSIVYECSRSTLAQFGYDGEYRDLRRPILLSKRWLVTEEIFSADCGGAYPSAGVNYHTWDLRTGNRVDILSWLTHARAKQADPQGNAADVDPYSKLRRVLASHWKRDDEDCKDIPDSPSTEWMIHPTAKGLMFTPSLPHVIAACAEDVLIPYAKILPLLNPTGRDAVASIRADIAAGAEQAK